MLYVVFYERKVPKVEERGILWEIAKGLMGPVIHAEIVFVKDARCECFNINARCPNGHPIIEYDKRYQEDDEDFRFKWVRIKVSHEQEVKARVFCEEAVRMHSYQISEKALAGCILPKELERWYTSLFTYVFQRKFECKVPETPCTPIHCAGLMATVLKDGCGLKGVPVDSTGSELLHHLLQVQKFELTTHPFGSFVPWKIRDRANFKRSLVTILSEEEDGDDEDDRYIA